MSNSSKAVVASGHPLVSQAAATVLGEGGNAFDGAVAAGFASAVVEPCLTSLGGGGFLLARTAEQREPAREIFFDFFVDSPGRGLAEIPCPHFFPVNVAFGGSDQEFNIGLGSVAVPGTLKGLLHVHDRLGRMDLAEVLAPALQLARGHQLNDFQGVFMELLRPILTMTPTGRELYQPQGRFLGQGDTLVNQDLAGFLEELPRDHGREFYCGEIARAMARDMAGGDGLLTREDLAAYEVIERKPLELTYGRHRILTSPPPSFGGSLIGLSLALHQEHPSSAPYGSLANLRRATAIMQEVERLRLQGMVSPKTLQAFLNSEQLAQAAATVRLFTRGTTQVSIADGQGNVASMTCSNGEGSGYFAPASGIMLNNMMGEDDLHPDGFHAGPAGQRVGSMMSPSLVLDAAGRVQLVIGSGGSKRIRTAITQVLTQVIDQGRPLAEAVAAPRSYWDGSQLQLEPGFGGEVIAELSRQVAVNCWQEQSVYFGGVHAVIPGGAGAGDPRRGGAAMVVES
ncbi:gamma-glutamyltransferase family protein [Desulfogranum mediterraneum]|uniref:gamma-glutamyltransferase family protein n=1 Tax=Desulfogranum mediterraneum TaxID=160661 RepID=UPI000404806B|nr:gamma-glutamyltransferase [Desulfogranum mediterraneum]